jgi:hypothetical protein
MKNFDTKIRRFLKKPRIQRAVPLTLALLVVISVAAIGTRIFRASHAATPGTMYVTPATGTFVPGATISVAIHEDSGTDAVNAVQSTLIYSPNVLQFVSVAEGTAFPTVLATKTSTAGEVRIGRGTTAGAPGATGDNVLATVTFKVLTTTGPTALSINNALSLIVRASDNANIMTASVGANYTIQNPPPTITTLTPTSGPVAGGNDITINGANLTSTTTVTVGGVAATNLRYTANATTTPASVTITATVPAHAAGLVSVVVTNPDGQKASGNYTYNALAPTVSAVSPASGPSVGGTTVTITGTNFASGATVVFGASPAASVTFVSATSLKAVTAGTKPGGALNVIVTNPDGSSGTKTGAFTFISPPIATSVSPASGFTAGGQHITITGTGFAAGATVTVGGSPATSVTVTGTTTITAVAPAHASGVAVIVVKNPDGQTSTLAAGYTYQIGGDANGDGRVNGIDYSIIAQHDGENYPPADFDGDGTVGAADLVILLTAWTW